MLRAMASELHRFEREYRRKAAQAGSPHAKGLWKMLADKWSYAARRYGGEPERSGAKLRSPTRLSSAPSAHH